MENKQIVVVSNETLKKFLGKFINKDLDIKCPDQKKRCCDEGKCLGRLTLNDDIYHLTTGIIPSPDHLGSLTFQLHDIKSLDFNIRGWVSTIAHSGVLADPLCFRIKRKK